MVHITLFAVSNILYFYISTSQSVCAVPNVVVFCSFFIIIIFVVFVVVISSDLSASLVFSSIV